MTAFAHTKLDCSLCHPELHTLCKCTATCTEHRKAQQILERPEWYTRKEFEDAFQLLEVNGVAVP